MAELAPGAPGTTLGALARKRWRAWLRAVHRDVGYLSIGFTLIYAISGIAQNHIEEWGDVSYTLTERNVALPAAIDAATPDATAIARVVAAVQLGTPTETFRAGDELRLTYANGQKVTAIGATITIQERSRRFFIGTTNWLHRARGKAAWKYISDVYAILLVYLAISGLLLIKGKLGFKWRGSILLAAGITVPVLYVVLSGGPGAPTPDEPSAPARVASPTATPPVLPTGDAPVPTPSPPDDPSGAVLKPLPPDDE
ncbi:MAG: PepSY-associated TM helix domain-containing protein [Proteobacteria bacterium]|nr:PepSY-associated TM helix domain-containing protein [Pseudomonadota bacterium]